MISTVMKVDHRFRRLCVSGGLVFVFANSMVAQVALPLGNAQRSRVFATRSIDTPPRQLLWQSDKLFRVRSTESIYSRKGPLRFIKDIPTDEHYTLPVVSGDLIFFTVNTGNAYFYAVDAATGKLLVRLRYGDDILSAVAAMGHTAFFGTEKGKVIAYDVSANKTKWVSEQKDAVFAYATPVVDDGVIYICSYETGLYALAADTGALLWRLKSHDPFYGVAVQRDDVTVVGTSALIALDKKTGNKKWETSVGHDFYGPAILDDQVFVTHFQGEVRAYSLSDGALKWKLKKRRGPGTHLYGAATQLTLFSGLVIYGEEVGNVVAVDARTGIEKWRLRTKERCQNPLVAGATLYTHCDDHYLYAIDPLTGSLKWSLDTKRNAYTPVIANGVMYALSSDGTLQAFR